MKLGSKAGERETAGIAERRRRAYFAAWVLRSLEKDGAGTVEDLVDRGGGAYSEMQLALHRLVSEKYVRRVKKEYGFLYVVERKGSQAEEKPEPVQACEPKTTRQRALALIRSAGALGTFQVDVENATGSAHKTVSAALNRLEKDGLVRRTFLPGRKIVWTSTEFKSSRGAPTREEAQRVRAGDPIMEFLFVWTSYARMAEGMKLSVGTVRSKMRTLRRNGCVESRRILCKDGRMRVQWRAIAARER